MINYVPLSSVVWFQEGPGVRNAQYTTEGVKLLNVSNLVDGHVDLTTSNRYISKEEAYGKYRHFLVDAGDLVIASSGIQVDYFDKKMGFINANQLPLCMNTSTIRFKVLESKRYDIRYFMYYLKSNQFKVQLQKQITGSAQLNFGPSHLKKMQVPMIPILEQKAIAEKLDKVSSLIEKRKQQLSLLDTLVKSKFVEMFGDPEINPHRFEKVTINDVCESIVRGPFGSSLKKEFFVEKSDKSYKVYEQKHAIQKSATIGTYYIDETKFKELSRFECKAGDFLMSCSGTMGEIYQLPENCERGIINQALCKFTLNKKIIPIYFLVFMRQTIGKLETKGSGIKNIAAVSYVKTMPVILPPIGLQTQFVAFVERIDNLKAKIKQSLAAIELLKKSLMQKYFG